MNHIIFSDNFCGVDLNAHVTSRDPQGRTSLRIHHIHRQNAVCAVDGLSALDNLYANRRPLRRKSSYSHASLCRTFSSPGVCTVDLSRKPSRYRSMPLGAIGQALPYGYSVAGQAIDSGRCQRAQRLAHLCRVRSTVDHASPQALRRRGPGVGSVEYGIRVGFDNDRSVPVAVSMGALSQHQGGSQDAHAVGFARQYSEFYPYFRRQTARRQRARSDDSRTGGDLRHGPRVFGFRPTLLASPGWRILRYSRQIEHRFPTHLLGTERSRARDYLRPNGGTVGLLQSKEVSAPSTAYSVQRYRNGEKSDIPDQFVWPSGSHHLRFVQSSLAGGIVFQMDQTASTHKAVLRNLGERSEGPNMDRGFNVRARSHYQEAAQPGCLALHFVADIFDHTFRENAFKQGLSRQITGH